MPVGVHVGKINVPSTMGVNDGMGLRPQQERRERKRERERMVADVPTFSFPKPLGSIYKGGENDRFHFILLVG
jgi:hypothetical protein